MSPLRRIGIGSAALLAVWTGLMLWLCGGLYDFLACDRAGEAAAADLRALVERRPGVVRQLAYLGDSNCVCVERRSTVPRLNQLLEQGVDATAAWGRGAGSSLRSADPASTVMTLNGWPRRSCGAGPSPGRC